jgi:hypothetical protein
VQRSQHAITVELQFAAVWLSQVLKRVPVPPFRARQERR